MVPAVAPRAGAAVDRLELLEAASGANGDTRQRRLREVYRHLRLVPKPLVEVREQRAAAGEHDPAVHDVRGELGRRLVERGLDRFENLRDGLVERAAYFLRREDDRLR